MKEREAYGVKFVVSEETFNEYKGTLQDQLEEKNKEIERLNQYIDFYKDLTERQNKSLERLQNIIDELEKWLLSTQERYKDYLSTKPTNDSEYNSKYATQSALIQLDVILDKLKDLKEGNKDE